MIDVSGYYQYSTGLQSKIRVHKTHKHEHQTCYFIEWADGDMARMPRTRIMTLIVGDKISMISKVEYDKAHGQITEDDKDHLLELELVH